MTRAKAYRRILAAVTISLTLAGCEAGSQNLAQNSVAGANETSGQTRALSPTRTGYAEVEGGRIHYQVYGDLDSGKTPLLVLHGSFMSGDTMEPIFGPFAAGRPVIAIDARGHGRSGETPGPITYELMADDAAAVLAALNVPSADVLGYSMGATTALFMASRHPDRVGKQIILAGTSRRDGWYPEVLQAMAQATPAMFAGSPIEAEYRRLSPNPDQFATFVSEVLALEEQDYAASDEAVRAIDDKTMIIVGDADGVALEHAIELFKLRGGGDREAAARGFLTGAPRARLAILPATSHIGIMAEAERIAELATPFLDDRLPPRATGFFEGMDAPPAPAPGPGNR
ncbi:alpha/beta fold hydrolase [Sphingosinicella sp. CPCC 101087]|uniref:alpha/beta fold hydrolase n=1 Tax=Sphingosinicella sp. CPCC 101087 TaxID=2497754 RepID=UPI0019824834|nr:alpha/beta hydrolase [Sphingosinicella sp. CPCC 101087]